MTSRGAAKASKEDMFYDEMDDEDMDGSEIIDRDLVPDETGHTEFISYAAEGDILLGRGEYRGAASSYKKALDKHLKVYVDQRDVLVRDVLVNRSKCWTQLGHADHALLDADRALALWDKMARDKVDKPDRNLWKGYLAKAEALYAATEFEMALVYYHRGYNLRKMGAADFELGIKKCRHAIVNAIGDPDAHELTVEGGTDFDKQLEAKKLKTETWEERLKQEMEIYTERQLFDFSENYPDTSPGVRVNPGGIEAVDVKKERARIHPDTMARLAAKPSLTMGLPHGKERTQGEKELERMREKTGKKVSKEEARTSKQLLGELDDDKEYLRTLLHDEKFQRVLETDEEIQAAVDDGITYLEQRKEFWGHQKPLYARQREAQERRLKRKGSSGATRRRLRPLGNGAQTERARPGQQKPRGGRPRSAGPRARQGSGAVGGPPGGAKGKKAREDYFETTRYAIQTLENVNNALEYGNPELGLTLAKNFLTRIGNMELADKPRILGNLYCSMANTYLELNRPTLAAVYHRKDLDIATTYKFTDATNRALGNLGRTYRRMGEYGQAIGFFERQAALASNAEDEGRAHLDIGRCHFEAGRYADAASACKTASELASEARDDKCSLRAALLLGQSLYLSKRYASALPHYEEHLRLAETTGADVADSTLEELETVRALAAEKGDGSDEDN